MADLKMQEACLLLMLEVFYCVEFYPGVWSRHHNEVAHLIAQEESWRYIHTK